MTERLSYARPAGCGPWLVSSFGWSIATGMRGRAPLPRADEMRTPSTSSGPCSI
jgi:hypothetical protein